MTSYHSTPEQAAELLTVRTGRKWSVYCGELCCRIGMRWAPVPYSPFTDLDALAGMAGRYSAAGFADSKRD